MTKRPYRLTTPAERDLNALADYIAERGGIDAALDVVALLHDAFESLAEFPECGFEREDLAPMPHRLWPVHSFLIVYRPRAPLVVVRILHAARDVRAALDEEPLE